MICTLGDVLLDVIVRTPDSLAAGADTPVETRIATGGQAANVAAWIAELGGAARCIAKRAADAAGELARALLEARGVELVGPCVEGSTGVVVALVGEDGERTMATDRGVSTELRSDELEARWLDGCEWLHLSGYALLAEPIAEAALAAARLARAREARVAVDLSSWSAIRAYGAERFRANLDAAAPDVVFANEPEWEMVGGAYALAETAVVKRGLTRGRGANRDRGRGARAARRRRGRHDGGRRRARGGLPRRRDRARARSGRALRGTAGGGAFVTRYASGLSPCSRAPSTGSEPAQRPARTRV